MKKTLIVLLALFMVLALAACSGDKSDALGEAEPTDAPELHIKDDTSLPGMRFTPQEGFNSVQRTLDKNADGSLVEKNLKYFYDHDVTMNFAYAEAKDQKLADLLKLDELESVDCGGVTFYIQESGDTLMAFAQDGDRIYGIEYVREQGSKDREALDNALKNLVFEDDETVTDHADPEVLGEITYQMDSSLTLASSYSDLTESADGDLQKKSYTWRFGKDNDNIDFRFLIRYDKDTKLEDALSKEVTYKDGKIGDLSCKIRNEKNSGKPIEYYIQNGKDVYEIKNLGSSNGWYSSHSDESHAAFEALIKTIAFKEAAAE